MKPKTYKHSKTQLSTITPEDREALEGLIEAHKIRNALKRIARGKVAGIDGLPSEFYSTCLTQLEPALLDTYNVAKQTGRLPFTATAAVIVGLPKPGRRGEDPSGYRPYQC